MALESPLRAIACDTCGPIGFAVYGYGRDALSQTKNNSRKRAECFQRLSPSAKGLALFASPTHQDQNKSREKKQRRLTFRCVILLLHGSLGWTEGWTVISY